MEKYCVLGLGKFGSTVANALVKCGKEVMIMDTDSNIIASLEKNFYHAVTVNQGWEAALSDGEIADYECAIVCIANNVNDNILATIRLKELGLKKIITRAISEGHKKVLEKILDVDKGDVVVFPEKDAGEALAQKLVQRINVTEFKDFHGYQFATRPVPKKWVGKSIFELDVRKKFGINIVAVTYGDNKVVSVTPDPNRKFIEQDYISIIAYEKEMDKILNKFN